MVREIVKDKLFLQIKSSPAVTGDEILLDDLMDTLRANSERCVGMAGNMIGVSKRIIAFYAGPFVIGMLNPKLISKSGPYETEEGCLSLDGTRKTIRYETIEVEYEDRQFQRKKMKYSGWTAQIIQHEIDHLEGILI
ncbi:MAG: peptide deformylase [Clostridia bacterium]|nr:peptide deformylase [Clostridia bacterium]